MPKKRRIINRIFLNIHGELEAESCIAEGSRRTNFKRKKLSPDIQVAVRELYSKGFRDGMERFRSHLSDTIHQQGFAYDQLYKED